MVWWATAAGAAGFNYNRDGFHVNGNDNLNNAGCSRGMTLAFRIIFMKSYARLYHQVCSKENLELAWKKARKRKTLRQYVLDFEEDLTENLSLLRTELLLHAYRPQPLKTFILRDPKTRKISVSDFRDRIVHHAICNVIEPIFEKQFIHDSYANRKGKGTFAALDRLQHFMQKVTKNGSLVRNHSKSIRGFVFKGDIKHYFDAVSHYKLMEVVGRIVKDKDLLFLLRKILANHEGKEEARGMPLGNLTSQFLANVYLNELDQYIKHVLKVKYYIRYVDDFVILHQDRNTLEQYCRQIIKFLEKKLSLELNRDKSVIKPLSRGIGFLGFRCFYHHRLLKFRNIRTFYKEYQRLSIEYLNHQIGYDKIYDFMEGWIACAEYANTHKFRKRLLGSFEEMYNPEISNKEINRLFKTAR